MNNPQRCIHGRLIGLFSCPLCDYAAYDPAKSQRIVMGVPNPPAPAVACHPGADEARLCIVTAWMELARMDGSADQFHRANLERWLQKALHALSAAPPSATFWLGTDG